MIKSQFTVAFHIPVDARELYEILARHYGTNIVEQGQGMFVNGLAEDWIVIANDKRTRLD